jgi:hypothetical protein
MQAVTNVTGRDFFLYRYNFADPPESKIGNLGRRGPHRRYHLQLWALLATLRLISAPRAQSNAIRG